jgi:hypothetical protein
METDHLGNLNIDENLKYIYLLKEEISIFIAL